jgi:hypothetical protein
MESIDKWHPNRLTTPFPWGTLSAMPARIPRLFDRGFT